ncbi:fosfomycin resistance protein FosB [Anatilimnocola aggregata]|uniref:Fosfomycin resistance protein FosB n=1 Tax=Anatilimnocola aggregata TaxID=2528021 RepID=A0A517YC92_9BACT|nr:VOC family protein [Anatilimnocola aggregata]QDU27866.1 fosfomycin resistance protein FosB [Anatilimnocola aggregata]
MKIVELNHVAIHVADLERSRAFFRDVLQLAEIERPAFDFPGAWFRLGTQQELHLIAGRQLATHSHNRGDHWALMVDDLDAWEAHLTSVGYPHFPRKRRPDGAGQVFLIDPDGHYIELCTPPGVISSEQAK